MYARIELESMFIELSTTRVLTVPYTYTKEHHLSRSALIQKATSEYIVS